MSGPTEMPPGSLTKTFRKLFPGPIGDEVCAHLEEEYYKRRALNGGIFAWVWYAGHLLLPSTWALVYKLRRRQRSRKTQLASAEGSPQRRAVGIGLHLLDFKLGFRMLIKYPGLTVIAGLAIAFAVAIGAGTFHVVTTVFYPRLPFEESDRMVEIWSRNISTGSAEDRVLHDFVTWRQELRSVEDIGAYQTFQRNLVADGGRSKPVIGAEMTAASFGITRVLPLLGSIFSEADEQPGAPNVVVIGFELWRSVFERDLDVVGQTVRLGHEYATIIGVMPEGFGFPLYHSLWTPLRLNVLDYERGKSPPIKVVARLSTGVSVEQANTELSAIGLRTSADFPVTHEFLRPTMVQYGRIARPVSNWAFMGVYTALIGFFAMLMLLVCANVALLLFARTAARQSEIVVRSALGATRRRIVTQLFVEALVLSFVAAVVGLWGAQIGIEWALSIINKISGALVPFFVDEQLTPLTVIYALAFAIFAAGVSGVVPALRVTGKRFQPFLQSASSGGGGLKFGALWTSIIVVQIAGTMVFMPFVVKLGMDLADLKSADFGFRADEYLSTRVQLGRNIEVEDISLSELRRPAEKRLQGTYAELKRRLSLEPGVLAVTYASQIPGAQQHLTYFDVEGISAPHRWAKGHRTATSFVDLDFFDALNVPITMGRGFDVADMESGSNVVVVNEHFVHTVLEDRSPIGRRMAYFSTNADSSDAPDELGPWYEIVGVVKPITTQLDPDLSDFPGVYHPIWLNEDYPVRMAIHLGGIPTSFVSRLYAITAAVDPALQLHEVRPMDEAAWLTEQLYGYWFVVILVAGGIGLLLSTSGIYAMMAYTVSRRTREIGVRVALGADRLRIVRAILSRALMQVGLGVGMGGVLVLGLFLSLVMGGSVRLVSEPAEYVGFFVAYLTLMFGICMLGCFVPTRRALAIEPTEALREE